jgi:hypothetical protein
MKNKKSLIKKLGLKKIPDINYDVMEVYENLEILLKHFFPNSYLEIKDKVEKLQIKYSHKIGDDYDKFFRLLNRSKDFQTWGDYYTTITSELPKVSRPILDLYFQMTVTDNGDIWGNVLIYAYLEDIQPYL